MEEGRGLAGASCRVSVLAVNWLPRMKLKAESGVVSEVGTPASLLHRSAVLG